MPIETGKVPAAFRSDLSNLGNAVPVTGGIVKIRQPAVAVFDRPSHRGIPPARHPNGRVRLLNGMGIDGGAIQLEMASFKINRILSPELGQHRQAFVGPAPPLLHVQSSGFEFHWEFSTYADTQCQTPS